MKWHYIAHVHLNIYFYLNRRRRFLENGWHFAWKNFLLFFFKRNATHDAEIGKYFRLIFTKIRPNRSRRAAILRERGEKCTKIKNQSQNINILVLPCTRLRISFVTWCCILSVGYTYLLLWHITHTYMKTSSFYVISQSAFSLSFSLHDTFTF